MPPEPDKALTFPLGEDFLLGADSKLGKLTKVIISRYSVVREVPSEAQPKDRLALNLRGVGLGVTNVVVFNDKGLSKSYTITIVPNLEFINARLVRQFPLARVKVSAGGENLLVAEGQVETVAEAQSILDFLKTLTSRNGGVINSMTVTGSSQVQLEVVIARIDRTALRRMASNGLYISRDGFVGTQVGNLLQLPAAPIIRDRPVMPGPPPFALTNPGISTDSTVFWGVTRPGFNLFGFLEALRQEESAKILATPTLVTLNGRPADFLVGGEQPYPVFQGSAFQAQPGVDFKPFGTRLTFVPVMLGQGKIRLDVVPEVSRPTTDVLQVGGINVPRFETQRIRATVEMESGQTLALGGLLQTVEEATVFKIPILGDLPWVGALFRRITHTKAETELLVLATPRIIEPMSSCQRPGLLPGQESRTPTDGELFLKGMIEAPLHVLPPPTPTGPSGAYSPLPLPVVPGASPPATLPPPKGPDAPPAEGPGARGARGADGAWWPTDGPLELTRRRGDVPPPGGWILGGSVLNEPRTK
jgi:pilus assembly protein CpaC